MRGRSVAALVATTVGIASCSPASSTERLVRSRSALLGGRTSGDDENANVVVDVTKDDSPDPLHCSGRLVAPRLVLTARHCLLKNSVKTLDCNSDGSPVDLGADQTLQPIERVIVKVGSDRSTLQSFVAQEALTVFDVTACRSDVAFLVLRDEALPVRTPLRRAPVRIGDLITISGWGLRGDGQTLPTQRSTLDGLRISDVGPGFIPPGTFSVGGNSLCFGDSGAVALVNGAVAGTYSRIDGDACASADSQNVLAGIAVETALVTRAFAAIGETPWYDDAPPADAGACDAGNCETSQRITPPAAPDSGCSSTHLAGTPGRVLWLALGLAITPLLRRITRDRS
jgi:hypothetical protein